MHIYLSTQLSPPISYIFSFPEGGFNRSVHFVTERERLASIKRRHSQCARFLYRWRNSNGDVLHAQSIRNRRRVERKKFRALHQSAPSISVWSTAFGINSIATDFFVSLSIYTHITHISSCTYVWQWKHNMLDSFSRRDRESDAERKAKQDK